MSLYTKVWRLWIARHFKSAILVSRNKNYLSKRDKLTLPFSIKLNGLQKILTLKWLEQIVLIKDSSIYLDSTIWYHGETEKSIWKISQNSQTFVFNGVQFWKSWWQPTLAKFHFVSRNNCSEIFRKKQIYPWN